MIKKLTLVTVLLLVTVFAHAQVGVGTTDPKSSFEVQGSMGYKVTTITSATTLTDDHHVILCNNGPYTVTLPPAAANTGRVYRIKNIDPSGDAITIDGNGSETIDGNLTYALQPYQYSITLISDGDNWQVIEFFTSGFSPTANAGVALSAICQGGTSAAMGGSVGGSATGGTWTGGAGTWTNATNPSTATYTADASESGNITLTLTTSGGSFGTTTATKTITVNATNTAGAASSTPTLCINTALTAITHTTTGATGIGAATGLPAGVTAAWASNTITISGTPTANGTFNYSIPLTGGCGSVNATGTITVTAANTAGAASSTPTLCVNTALTNITHITTGATGIGAATGLPAGVTAAWASNTITISGTPTANGTFNYSIPLTGGCGSVNATGTITVTAANTAGTASSNPTLCINTALTNITRTTTGATGIGTATGLPTGVTAAWASNTITINGTPTANGTFNYSIPLTGGCGSVNATGTITVTAANTAGAASSTPTLDLNTALTAITHTTTGATGIGAATGLPAGVTAAWASNTITISGTPTASGTFNYSIPLTGGCGSINATGTIIVALPCLTNTTIVDVINPYTGKTWMDRNLGAYRVPATSRAAYATDAEYIAAEEASFGNLYQWGRAADGHQCRNSTIYDAVGPNGVANFNNNIGNAWYGKFIPGYSGARNWVDPTVSGVDNLWQGVSGTNNPCPSGYRLPTQTELNNERLSWVAAPINSTNNSNGAFASPLKFPITGARWVDTGGLYQVGVTGRYWSSTVLSSNAQYLYFNSSTSGTFAEHRAYAFSVRCIKN